MTTIHFVRHGEVHNPRDIFYARLPRFRLSATGRQQAQAAGLYLKSRPISAVFSSPLLRARQTAQTIAGEVGQPIQISTLLNEIYTPYQGRPFAEMEAIGWNIYENIPPHYDQPEAILQRIRRFAQGVCRRYPGGEVVAVTHGDILLHARLWAQNLPPTHQNRRGVLPYPEHASLNSVVFENNQPRHFSYYAPYSHK
jgi:broad specificity phosphatase PhoE